MDLDDWRSRINNLDAEILKLLNQRGHAALQIGDLKRQQDRPYYVPEREAEVVDARRLAPIRGHCLRARCARSGARSCPPRWPSSTRCPSRTSALRRLSRTRPRCATSARPRSFVPVKNIADIFDEVERGRAEYGVVPVENSTEGAVNITLDRLIDSDVLITGEVTLDIAQHLLSLASDLSEVKTVCSHPQALAQCRQWLATHLPDAAVEDMPSTTAAAERAKDDPTVAGIASEMAAHLYDVPILRARIEDNPSNSTRFLVIGRRAAAPRAGTRRPSCSR